MHTNPSRQVVFLGVNTQGNLLPLSTPLANQQLVFRCIINTEAGGTSRSRLRSPPAYMPADCAVPLLTRAEQNPTFTPMLHFTTRSRLNETQPAPSMYVDCGKRVMLTDTKIEMEEAVSQQLI
ncbi:hypothetical protein NDU88_003932 [Pleurodeles waltl]|uniref:Uncharacterized protein n=1 Tax=Pleurodeles waltl TaxID=8319 RepID=A0AAV7LIB7_PLEWA|nr:hypothetical protein NDU88_003932 [Pleurodeles waltl]